MKPDKRSLYFGKGLMATCVFWMGYMTYHNLTHVMGTDYHFEHLPASKDDLVNLHPRPGKAHH
jgi:hypothetical protein